MAVQLVFLMSTILLLSSGSPTPRCCMYNQWEGMLFFEFAAAGSQGDYTFSNGTTRVSYDIDNSMSLVNFEMYRWSLTSPISRYNAVVISHFKTGVKYTISVENRTCEKGSLSTKLMSTYCASDFHENEGHPRGSIGGTMPVTNLDILEEIIYSTIYQDGSNCMPLFASGFIKAPGLGINGGADFMDLEQGIKDPSVFSPPSYCPENLSGEIDDTSFFGLASFFHKKL
ncbi:ependymin-like [Ylistrum balloti]|uniref:ependymin-like n=1 Tax=Ylistrum balloti TaxID=509963 RepID=UPI002905A4E2|nr:ependymin-like [Ylistrum balloti]